MLHHNCEGQRERRAAKYDRICQYCFEYGHISRCIFPDKLNNCYKACNLQLAVRQYNQTLLPFH